MLRPVAAESANADLLLGQKGQEHHAPIPFKQSLRKIKPGRFSIDPAF
jgi:hypothetical protein